MPPNLDSTKKWLPNLPTKMMNMGWDECLLYGIPLALTVDILALHYLPKIQNKVSAMTEFTEDLKRRKYVCLDSGDLFALWALNYGNVGTRQEY